MAFTRYILPALAVAGVALAQCDGPSTTIQSQGDAAALANCATVTGDVIISSSVSGQIAINGVQQITGNLECQNAAQLTEISADQLNSIGKTFALSNLTILATLQFNSLTSVNGINWVGLPALQGLAFDQGLQNAQNVLISNTQLNNLIGIDLTTVAGMNINNNPYLGTANVNNLANVTGALEFSANAASLAISFPNLDQAGNLTFRNVSSVSLPSLSRVNGSMGFYSDTMQSFAAPNLTTTGGSVAFVDCPNLSNISLPIITEIGGGLLVANNSQLKDIDGFPELQTIVGALDFSGTFDNATLPAIKDVRGGANIQTSSSSFSCTPFQNDASKNPKIIKGVLQCASSQSSPGGQGSTATGTGVSSSSTSKSDAGVFDPSTPLTGLGALVAALLMI